MEDLFDVFNPDSITSKLKEEITQQFWNEVYKAGVWKRLELEYITEDGDVLTEDDLFEQITPYLELNIKTKYPELYESSIGYFGFVSGCLNTYGSSLDVFINEIGCGGQVVYSLQDNKYFLLHEDEDCNITAEEIEDVLTITEYFK